MPVKENGEILPRSRFSTFVGHSDLSKCVSPVVHTQFSSGYPVSTDGAHSQEGARMVPADAATCMAILRFLHILRFLQALFVTIFENRVDTYSADPLDYRACKLSLGKYRVLVMMGRNFMEKERSPLFSPLFQAYGRQK